jgi:ABC-type uncharacterized transport system auxiliary subunit
MMRGIFAAVVALTAAVVVAGCVGAPPPVPRDHYYRLVVEPPVAAGSPHLAGVLAVAPLEADGLLRERPVLYSTEADGHEVMQHDYHYWTDPPTRMVQAQMVDYMQKSGIAEAVVTPDLRVPADFEISGRIKRLERLVDGGPPRVAVEIQLALIELPQNRLMVMDDYAAEVRSRDDSVGASIAALNSALGKIFERFLRDAERG